MGLSLADLPFFSSPFPPLPAHPASSVLPGLAERQATLGLQLLTNQPTVNRANRPPFRPHAFAIRTFSVLLLSLTFTVRIASHRRHKCGCKAYSHA